MGTVFTILGLLLLLGGWRLYMAYLALIGFVIGAIFLGPTIFFLIAALVLKS